jgi:hypothetical protein
LRTIHLYQLCIQNTVIGANVNRRTRNDNGHRKVPVSEYLMM